MKIFHQMVHSLVIVSYNVPVCFVNPISFHTRVIKIVVFHFRVRIAFVAIAFRGIHKQCTVF